MYQPRRFVACINSREIISTKRTANLQVLVYFPFPKVFMNSTFMSVTGQRLELGHEAENQGQFAATIA